VIAPQLIAGRYELHEELAAGGMARVHFARLRGDQGFQRVVAVKRMHRQFARDPRFLAMFRDEAILASRIRHPNVVPTLDVVSDADEAFIVMEYVRGLPLSLLLARANRNEEAVPVPIAVAILSGVLAGLHAAHEARGADGAPLHIVHRDVSPQNILVDVDGVARVMDFGIAKASTQLHVTLEGELKGKLSYMAPEQLRGGAVDRRVDVWAATVVLYSMLVGAPLFSRGELEEITKRILQMPIPLLSARRDDVPAALAEVIAKGVERNPDKRHRSARDLQVALEAGFERVASARQVGAWVERLGGDMLEERDRAIARIEGGASVDPVGLDPDATLVDSHMIDAPMELTETDAPTLELAPSEPVSPHVSAPSSAPAAHAPASLVEAERTSASVVSEVAIAPRPAPRPAGKAGPLTLLGGATFFAAAAAIAIYATREPEASSPDRGRAAASAGPEDATPPSAATAPSALDPASEPTAAAAPSASAAPLEAPSASAAPLEAPSASASASATSSAAPLPTVTDAAPTATARRPPGYFPSRP